MKQHLLDGKVVSSLRKSTGKPGDSTVFFDNFSTDYCMIRHLEKKYKLRSLGTICQTGTGEVPLEGDKKLAKEGRGIRPYYNGTSLIRTQGGPNICSNKAEFELTGDPTKNICGARSVR